MLEAMRAASRTRRDFLASGAGVAAALLSPLAHLGAAQPPLADGRLVSMLRLGDPQRRDDPPLNQLLGSGLDARLFTDLSTLSAGDTLTSADRFFVRTACPGEAVATGGVSVAGARA